jgi:PAS domain S-box-containing protein
MECTLEEKKYYFKVKQLSTAFEDGTHGTTLIVEDVTAHITYQRILELNEARYRGIVEDQTEFITRFLPDGALVFVNDAYARYLGKKKEELLGMQHIPDLMNEDIAAVNQSIRSLDAENPVKTFDCRIHHSCGDVRWNLWTVRALFDGNNKPLEYQGVGKDNNEKREAAVRINQYVRDLEFLSRKAQEFVEISPEEDIFKRIGQGLSELLPSAVISVNSYDPITEILTVRSVVSERDHQIFSACIGQDYLGFRYPLCTVPDQLRTLGLSALQEGKLFHTDESLCNFCFHVDSRGLQTGSKSLNAG